jgi:hypothetical protein
VSSLRYELDFYIPEDDIVHSNNYLENISVLKEFLLRNVMNKMVDGQCFFTFVLIAVMNYHEVLCS